MYEYMFMSILLDSLSQVWFQLHVILEWCRITLTYTAYQVHPSEMNNVQMFMHVKWKTYMSWVKHMYCF